MPLTEVGCMGVKPDLDVMNPSTPEGKILKDLYDFVLVAPGGPSRTYYGLEIENPSNLWAFFDFESVEEHKKFAEKNGEKIVGELTKILSHGEFSGHVQFTPSTPLILQSPVTEVMLAYFPSSITADARSAASARFQQFLEKALNTCKDVRGISYGWGLENDFPVRGIEDGEKGTLLTALIGWGSVDEHMRFRQTKEYKDNVGLITGMEGLIDIKMVHVKCRCAASERE